MEFYRSGSVILIRKGERSRENSIFGKPFSAADCVPLRTENCPTDSSGIKGEEKSGTW